ncbi:hypothetical protein RJ639_007012 [Escallonia herrerae]|uniref:Uncharacterized protein n=1 Tax=Escallonia herrerae TaxID=1293975 RepID=A0AA88VX63_9ASTE|nr:hypothetical protein RJ639_007012 [Escallonia herrerae]
MTISIDGALYWAAFTYLEDCDHGEIFLDDTKLIKFDVAREEFKEVKVPIQTKEYYDTLALASLASASPDTELGCEGVAHRDDLLVLEYQHAFRNINVPLVKWKLLFLLMLGRNGTAAAHVEFGFTMR